MGQLLFSNSLAASKLNFFALGSFTVSAPQHGLHFRAFSGGRQCTGSELEGDCE